MDQLRLERGIRFGDVWRWVKVWSASNRQIIVFHRELYLKSESLGLRYPILSHKCHPPTLNTLPYQNGSQNTMAHCKYLSNPVIFKKGTTVVPYVNLFSRLKPFVVSGCFLLVVMVMLFTSFNTQTNHIIILIWTSKNTIGCFSYMSILK